MNFHLFLIVFLTVLLGCNLNDEKTENSGVVTAPSPGFTLLPSSETSITFTNTLTEGPNTNILVYEYFYNGGGVATADFNFDGRPDLYFTANMTLNQLYLNRGDMQFEEVSATAGAGGRAGPWSTGVTIVDINLDGQPDIYLSYSGMLPPDKRRNQLLVHQGLNEDGIPIFKEQAAAYGLNLPAFTNQAYFFDYDGDGDLDVAMLNHNPKALPVLNVRKTTALLNIPDADRGLRLYQRRLDTFVDVTESAGINGSALSYGLGLALSDVDGDGDIDLYVSNDYEVPDYLYLNNGNGTFTDVLAERMGHTSHFSMGSDIADVDNDGNPDIFTLDMLPADHRRRQLLMADDNRSKHDLNAATGFTAQHMRNMLHLNRGEATFAEIGQLAGLAATDWSWSALLADFDNDGRKDLHVTNGYVRDYTNLDFIKYMDDFVTAKDRLQRSDVLELLQHMPASGVSNTVYRNTPTGTFEDLTEAWQLERPSNSNGAITVDLDQDGDLDLVINNLNQPAFIYRNDLPKQHFLQIRLTAPPNIPVLGTRVTVTADSLVQTQECFTNRGYLSSGPTLLHYGIGAGTRVQHVEVTWPNGRRQHLRNLPIDQVVGVNYEGSTAAGTDSSVSASIIDPLLVAMPVSLNYQHHASGVRDFDRQALLPHAMSSPGPIIAAADLDEDGTFDLVVGGDELQPPQVVLGVPGTAFQYGKATALPAVEGSVTTDLLLQDFNLDGHLDIYVAHGGYGSLLPGDRRLQDLVYLNDGEGKFTPAQDAFLPTNAGVTGTVAGTLINGTSYLFVGGGVVPGAYPLASSSRLLQLKNGTYNTIATLDLGMLTDAAWLDLDGDDLPELITVGQWQPIKVHRLVEGRLVDVTATYFSDPTDGWWNVLTVADLNADGRPDLLAGNQGTNYALSVAGDRPAYLNATDIDNNGSTDPLVFVTVDDTLRPELTRDELIAQLPRLRAAYPDYASYAGTTAAGLLSHLSAPFPTLRVSEQRSMVFLQNAQGSFTAAPLPIEAQYASVHSMAVFDADGDGIDDVLLAANEYTAKLRYGNSDASVGTLLRGLGDGTFHYVSQRRSGLELRGAVRSMVSQPPYLLFGVQNGPVRAYRSELPVSR